GHHGRRVVSPSSALSDEENHARLSHLLEPKVGSHSQRVKRGFQPGFRTRAWKYSSVSRSPSERGTRGSQARSCFARLMSGLRTFGSSCGSGRSSIVLLLPDSARISFANSRIVTSSGLPRLTGR